jgi:class 3 adenylate cyclase
MKCAHSRCDFVGSRGLVWILWASFRLPLGGGSKNRAGCREGRFGERIITRGWRVTITTCSACSMELAAGASFCSSCGASSEQTSKSREAGREERRLVSVLFSDASGYTQMAESLDPEVVRELMGLVYARANEIVSKYGGRVDKLMGDAVLAVFGDPVTHEDDAVRAVLAAIEIHEAVADLGPQIEAVAGRRFEMHSGVNTGVIVTSDAMQDRTSGPLGDMVNVAARLQSLATEGEILIGSDTAALVEGHVALTDLGVRELKGRRDSVAVSRVEGRARTQVASRLSGRFVGRDEELGVLLGAVESVRDGVSSVITVCAEAGAGKTRLLQEFQDRLNDDVQWLEGRAYHYSSNTPYAPLIDLLDRVAGIDEQDETSGVIEKITTMVNGVLPGDDETLSVVGHLYGLDLGSRLADPEAYTDLLLGSLTKLLDAVALRAPTVVCLQDLHWVDSSTADLVRLLVTSTSSPLVTICNFRPGFELGAEGERALQLEVLTSRQTGDLLTSLLGGTPPPTGLTDWVVERSDGNPFFVEEIVNSLLDRDVLVSGSDGWTLTAPLDSDTVPPTIRGLLAARIDALPAESRRLLREASVVGREFLHRIVQAVTDTPTELEQTLVGLTSADFIREHNLDPELEYIFKHALTQEVAYEGLLLRDRQLLHERVAVSIETQMPGRLEEFTETLAYHYQRSGHVTEAVGYLRRAGRKALQRYALPEAQGHYHSAYELLTADDAVGADLNRSSRDRLLLELMLEWSIIFYYDAGFIEQSELFARHVDLPDLVNDAVLSAQWKAWETMVHWMHTGEIFGSIEAMNEALEMAVRCDDPVAQGYAMAWLSWMFYVGGQPQQAAELWPGVQTLLPRIDDADVRQYVHIKALSGAAFGAATHGDGTLAETQAHELLEIGRATGSRRALVTGHCVLIAVHLFRGDIAALNTAVAEARAVKADRVYSYVYDVWAVGVSIAYGDPTEARELFETARPLAEEVEIGINTVFYDYMACQLDLIDGKLSRAVRGLEAERRKNQARGLLWAVCQQDGFFAIVLARTATGEAAASTGAALRNPSFVRRYGLGIAKKARRLLEAAHDLLSEHGYTTVLVDIELAKLAAHDGRLDDAKRHALIVQTALADTPNATFYQEAQRIIENPTGHGS